MRQVSDIMSSTSSYGYYLLPNTYYLLPNTYYLIKELLNLLAHHTQAEYNDMVSGTNQRISGYEHSFAIANHTSDGCSLSLIHISEPTRLRRLSLVGSEMCIRDSRWLFLWAIPDP